MADVQRQTVNPPGAPRPIAPYSLAVRVKCDELAFIAGQVAVDAEGNLVGEGDVGAQTRQVFSNLGAILKGLGGGFSSVLELTIYLVGRESVQPYIEARGAIFDEIFPKKDFPTSTLLVISGLAREEFLVEIKAIAAL